MAVESIWGDLIENLAVVFLMAALWSRSLIWLDSRSRAVRAVLTGGIIGAGAVASMLQPIDFVPGVFFDLRAALVSVGAFFGGPIVGGVAVLVAGTFRAALGGAGAPLGVTCIVAAAGLGLVARRFAGSQERRLVGVAGLALAVGALQLAILALVPGGGMRTLGSGVAAPVAAMAVVGTIVTGVTMHLARRSARERLIMRAALTQAPEMQYVKNRASAFIAGNTALARHFGFASADDLVGKTDFDVHPEPHAGALFAAEQEMLRTGRPIVDFEERVLDAAGRERWLRTSKSPVRDSDGAIIGLAGVSLDVTAQKRLEGELEKSRRLLELAMAEMRDAIVLFDADARLVFCNRQYLQMFYLTADVRRPGARLRDVLRAMAQAGEQVNIPADVDAWVAGMEANLFVEREQELHMHDGRILHRRNCPVADGGALVVIRDVTEIKRAERAYRAANAELSIQASTDGLTGLANRRAFDAALAQLIERSARERGALGLLIVDADRFKAFNDIYGHQAGDDCLRTIAQCLRAAASRPTDIVARYGGEEFAVILPDTDEAGAARVAAEIRRLLHARDVRHDGSETGRATVSVGLAHFGPETLHRSASLLIGRADEALYAAKSGGRDRLDVWRERLSA